MSAMKHHLEYKTTASGRKVGYVLEHPGIILQADTLEALIEEANKIIPQYHKLYGHEIEPMGFEQIQLSV